MWEGLERGKGREECCNYYNHKSKNFKKHKMHERVNEYFIPAKDWIVGNLKCKAAMKSMEAANFKVNCCGVQ